MSARNDLSLARKVEVIEYRKKNPTLGSRKIAEAFKCGRTQIQNIIKNKEAILSEYEAFAPASRKRHRGGEFEGVNEAVYTWYSLARQRSVPVTGPMLQEEARIIAEKMGHHQFRASNGWLESFKKRHNIRQFTVSGEAADVSDETVEAWHERLNSIMIGYKAEDVWNEDETGCFYRALPDKSLSEKKKECKGGKKSKERLTIAFFANAAGGKEQPIVIGRAAKPRCFKGIRDEKNPEGIPYYANPKAWMTTQVMTNILTILNKRLVKERRNILLLMDNVSSHDPNMKDKFSNIKVVFLPKNTTSRLQPLDAGIIKNFKVHYRRLLLKHTLAQIDGTDLTASSIVKTVNVLTAIRWIKKAWEAVQPQTIINCFRKTGALPQDGETESDEDPFADIEEEDMSSLDELVHQINPDTSANDYIDADEGLSTSLTFDDTHNWREEVRALACEEGRSASKQTRDEESDDSEDEIEPEVSSITSYQVALRLSNDLLLFFTQSNEEELAGAMFNVITQLESAKLAVKTKQTSILQYFGEA